MATSFLCDDRLGAYMYYSNSGRLKAPKPGFFFAGDTLCFRSQLFLIYPLVRFHPTAARLRGPACFAQYAHHTFTILCYIFFRTNWTTNVRRYFSFKQNISPLSSLHNTFT
jgi:hypothetical protein